MQYHTTTTSDIWNRAIKAVASMPEVKIPKGNDEPKAVKKAAANVKTAPKSAKKATKTVKNPKPNGNGNGNGKPRNQMFEPYETSFVDPQDPGKIHPVLVLPIPYQDGKDLRVYEFRFGLQKAHAILNSMTAIDKFIAAHTAG